MGGFFCDRDLRRDWGSKVWMSLPPCVGSLIAVTQAKKRGEALLAADGTQGKTLGEITKLQISGTSVRSNS
jgi:hypothetical protein